MSKYQTNCIHKKKNRNNFCILILFVLKKIKKNKKVKFSLELISSSETYCRLMSSISLKSFFTAVSFLEIIIIIIKRVDITQTLLDEGLE